MLSPTLAKGLHFCALSTDLPTAIVELADWDLKDGGEDSTAMSRRSGPSSGFILNKPCLHKRVQEINLRAGLAGLTRPVHAAFVWHGSTSAEFWSGSSHCKSVVPCSRPSAVQLSSTASHL